MGKRKRTAIDGDHPKELDQENTKLISSFVKDTALAKGKEQNPSVENDHLSNKSTTIQIIIGSYEKILHGVALTVAPQDNGVERKALQAEFADTFLFNAHGSAIRCLAISPPSTSANASASQKIILASGSSDQTINLYHISNSVPPHGEKKVSNPSLTGNRVAENPGNRELGSLQHHNSSINALYFPTRSKLLSAADDNTIAILRTRDWAVLSTIKAPLPKAHGRPSGDTAPLGGTPAGVNDFAVHPSLKLMVSVGKGEKCMRLWNLVTGKKAGVLSFEKGLLQGIGEGRWSSGDGRKVKWNTIGEEFVVGFERGAAVFGMDCKPRYRILPLPSVKIHQLLYVNLPKEKYQTLEILAVSTEDGRILLYSTRSIAGENPNSETRSDIPTLQAFGEIGGVNESLVGRIKDFEIINAVLPGNPDRSLIVIAGSSDGAIRVWSVEIDELMTSLQAFEGNIDLHERETVANGTSMRLIHQLGQLLGTYKTGNRITCLKAFLMHDPKDADDGEKPSDENNHMRSTLDENSCDSPI